MTKSPRNIHDIHADLNWLNTYGTLALFNSLLAITNYASDIKSCLLSHQNINSTHICACINVSNATHDPQVLWHGNFASSTAIPHYLQRSQSLVRSNRRRFFVRIDVGANSPARPKPIAINSQRSLTTNDFTFRESHFNTSRKGH